MSMSVNGMKN